MRAEGERVTVRGGLVETGAAGGDRDRALNRGAGHSSWLMVARFLPMCWETGSYCSYAIIYVTRRRSLGINPSGLRARELVVLRSAGMHLSRNSAFAFEYPRFKLSSSGPFTQLIVLCKVSMSLLVILRT